jgi:hypothetical protein
MNSEDLSKLINEDLKIDHFSIETDWRKQALIYYKWSKLLAESQCELNEVKANLNYIEASLSDDIRKNYKKYDLRTHPTETAIRNIVFLNKDYIEASRKQFNLTVKTDLLNSAVRALEHKKSALEYLNYKPEFY